MTLEEFYNIVGGNYKDAIDRLMGEEMLRRFVARFPGDPSFSNLEQALRDGCREDAFRAAHTLKGLCLNLEFGKLHRSSHDLTEALRHEMADNAAELFEALKLDYALTIGAIANL